MFAVLKGQAWYCTTESRTQCQGTRKVGDKYCGLCVSNICYKPINHLYNKASWI